MKTRLIEWLLSMLGDENDNDFCKHYAKRLGRSFAEESERGAEQYKAALSDDADPELAAYTRGRIDAYAHAAALVWRFFALPESLRPDVAKDIDIKIPISWQ